VLEAVAHDRRERWVDSATPDADEALVALYTAHYRSLVRLAALLLHDTPAAEDVVQDAFVAMHRSWRRLRDPEKALAYLRQSVVNRARSRLRHLKVADKHSQTTFDDAPSAETGAMQAVERDTVMAAVRRLPQRQREVLVLRYYADLSEAQIAEALGISPGAVKSHASRGAAALRHTLEPLS
jgi:RNA polymerase sigma-70 factor (sigma-E family)